MKGSVDAKTIEKMLGAMKGSVDTATLDSILKTLKDSVDSKTLDKILKSLDAKDARNDELVKYLIAQNAKSDAGHTALIKGMVDLGKPSETTVSDHGTNIQAGKDSNYANNGSVVIGKAGNNNTININMPPHAKQEASNGDKIALAKAIVKNTRVTFVAASNLIEWTRKNGFSFDAISEAMRTVDLDGKNEKQVVNELKAFIGMTDRV